ncbi:MAG: hypothetical protein IBX45_06525 [Campylobacterales bacterium]|nr:hypothetical protein [Campylobacterales bacterium]
MQTIHLNNAELEQYIYLKYGDDDSSLLRDFVTFLKTDLHTSNLKKSLEEVKQFKEGTKTLSTAEDFLTEIKSGN